MYLLQTWINGGLVTVLGIDAGTSVYIGFALGIAAGIFIERYCVKLSDHVTISKKEYDELWNLSRKFIDFEWVED